MYEVELFPEESCRVAADPRETLPVSWVPRPPEQELDLEPVDGAPKRRKVKRPAGPVPPCVRCPRSKTNTTCEPVIRPLKDKGGDPAHGKLLVVLYGYGGNVSYVTDALRAAGWAGTIYFDLILRCGTGEVDPKHVDACRGHLAFTLSTIKPDRILTCGSYAARAVLGETVMVHATRGAWQVTQLNGKDVPIVYTCATQDAMTNRFYEGAFLKEVDILIKTPWDFIAKHEGTARVIQNRDDVREFVEWAAATNELSVDLETDGIQFKPGFKVLSVAVARDDSNLVYVFFHEALTDPSVVWYLLEVLRRKWLLGWNIGYDVQSIWLQWEVDLTNNIRHDGKLAYKGLNAGYPADLEEVSLTLGFGAFKAEAAAEIKTARELVNQEHEGEDWDSKRWKAFAYKHLSPIVHVRYVARDALSALVCVRYYVKLVDEHPFLPRTYHQVQMPACRKFVRTRRKGMLIDLPKLATTQAFLEQRAAELTESIAKHGIDPDKSDSIRAFFEREGIKATRLTPKAREAAYLRGREQGVRGPVVLPTDKRSTDKRALEALRDEHTAIAEMIDYRKVSKLLSASVKNIWQFIGPDHRVHPDVNQDGAVTGRDSVKQPAVHSTPSAEASPEAKLYKSCFIAPPNHRILVFDFKALEPWVAAYRSGDPEMLRVHHNDLDFHTETAKGLGLLAWGMTPEEVEAHILSGDKRKLRKKAKITGLATMYGIGPAALGESIGTTKDEAEKLIDGFNSHYSGYHKWTLANHAHLDVHGYVCAEINGAPSRIRTLWQVGFPDWMRKGAAYRAAGNMPVQSAGSDYCQIAGNRAHEFFEAEGIPAYLLLQQHDSLIIEAHEDVVPLVSEKVPLFMHDFDIPLLASLEIGPSWGEVEKVRLPAFAA